MNTPTILLEKGTSFVDWLIRWQTRSRFSHAMLRISPDTVLESYPGAGVRERTIAPAEIEQCEEFVVPSMSAAQWALAVAFMRHEIGCGYDWLSISRFVTRLRGGSTGRWFCSEIIFAALATGGCTLLNDCQAWEIPPRDLSRSTLVVTRRAALFTAAFGAKAAGQEAPVYWPKSKKP